MDRWMDNIESEQVDVRGKQFVLSCQSCGRIWLRNAILFQVKKPTNECKETC
jgi:hypothetical protein